MNKILFLLLIIYFNIPIPIQELGFDSVGYFSNFSLAPRSVSINTKARLNQKNLSASWSKYQFLNRNRYSSFAKSPYESQITFLWDKIVHERPMQGATKLFPKNMYSFLEHSVDKLSNGERILIAFYPKNCGFDYLVEDYDSFVDMDEFLTRVKDLGFKIIFCLPEHHLVHFENQDQLKEFIHKTFETDLKREEAPGVLPI